MEETKNTTQILIENLPVILTALAGLVTAIFGGVVAVLNLRRTGRVEGKTDQALEEIHATTESSRSNSAKIDELHSTVNGKSEELLQATQELAFVKGAIAASPAMSNEILDEAKNAALVVDEKHDKGE